MCNDAAKSPVHCPRAHRARRRFIDPAVAHRRLIDFEGHRRLIDFEGVFYARAAVFSTSYEGEAPLAKNLRRFFVFVLQ